MPRRSSKRLGRRTERRPERRTIVVVCEGRNTEPQYIAALKRLQSVRATRFVRIEINPHRTVPMDLVSDAIELRNAEIDEIWCVFDVEWPENHPNLRQAVALAEQYGIRTAISNPCFELWLLLHFRAENAFLTTDEAERKSRAADGRVGKSIDADRYVGQRAVAIERAKFLAQRHRGNGTSFPRDNPSSSMDQLVLAIDPKSIRDRTDGR